MRKIQSDDERAFEAQVSGDACRRQLTRIHRELGDLIARERSPLPHEVRGLHTMLTGALEDAVMCEGLSR